jgi:hypothetical protein
MTWLLDLLDKDKVMVGVLENDRTYMLVVDLSKGI